MLKRFFGSKDVPHNTNIELDLEYGFYQGVCSCGWRSLALEYWAEAKEANDKHEESTKQ